MIYPPINELMKKVDSRYTLCNVVAKRARQMLDAAHQLAEGDSEKPITAATNEFYEGKLIYIPGKNKVK